MRREETLSKKRGPSEKGKEHGKEKGCKNGRESVWTIPGLGRGKEGHKREESPPQSAIEGTQAR